MGLIIRDTFVLYITIAMSKTNKIIPGGGLPAKLSQPALRALYGAGYTTLEQLTKVSGKELMQLHGFGPTGLVLIKQALQEKGLSLAKEKK